MAFIQPCFIRKNSPEIRKKLEELGYEPSYPIFQYPEVFKHIAACNFFGSKYYGVSDDEVSHHGEIKDAIKNRGMIDCVTNEDLFLALAALRDDTNENQWFIAQDTMWDENYDGEITVYYEEGEWLLWDYYSFMEDMPSDFRKATVEEIIAHFNNQ
jgi:hypothetical protein